MAGSNPASPSLGISERLFSLKRFQGDGVVAGFPNEGRNRHVGVDHPQNPPGTRSRTLNPKVAEDKKHNKGAIWDKI